MNNRALNVGVDVGGTNIKFGITDESGAILQQHRIKTGAERGSDAILQDIVEGIHVMLANAHLHSQDLKSIGLGVPGTADSNSGVVIYAPNIFWNNVLISPIIEKEFSIPVYLAQDTRAAAWAEYLVGAARGSRGVACVTIGTGVGCGFVLNGRIFHGALNTAGEFGHQIVQIDGAKCNCGRYGCLEAHAGGLAIVRRAIEMIPSIESLLHKCRQDIGVEDVYHLASDGNEAARKLTDEVVQYIGVGLVNLLNLASVDTICISGGISNAPSELLFDPLLAFVRSRAYIGASNKVKMCRSGLGDDAPMIGASLLYREFSANQSSPEHASAVAAT